MEAELAYVEAGNLLCRDTLLADSGLGGVDYPAFHDRASKRKVPPSVALRYRGDLPFGFVGWPVPRSR